MKRMPLYDNSTLQGYVIEESGRFIPQLCGKSLLLPGYISSFGFKLKGGLWMI
jgi:hypothetical protein